MTEDIKNINYFTARRKKLLSKIDKNSIVIIPGNMEIIRNGDGHYSFRQNSSFYYLTGFNEPDSLAVLTPSDDSPNGEFILFVRPRDPAKEQWDGLRAGLDGAKSIYKADQGYDISDINGISKTDTKIIDLLKNKAKIYYSIGHNKYYDKLVINWLNQVRAMQRAGVSAPAEIVNLDSILAEMRLIKDDYEQDLMRKAGSIAAAGHCKAMIAAKNCKYEYEVEAELLYEFNKQGARSLAYNSIVGSGANTCILHYSENNQTISQNSLILIDAGCEYENYASDITRTFPANGKFTAEQKAIYELVLSSQLAAIDIIKPGITWERAQDVILEIITSGLVKLGIIKANGQNIAELITNKAYMPFYMHKSGHWLGLDVHDVGEYKIDNKWRKLEAGMVLTIEPGIYIMANMPNVDKKWWDIGVRIEDDVLVTANGHEVLSKEVPKEIAEIESLMGR